MERFGFPKLIIRLLKALHEKVLVNFEVEGVRKVIESIIGVKQGDLLGPILFSIYGSTVTVEVEDTQSRDARARGVAELRVQDQPGLRVGHCDRTQPPELEEGGRGVQHGRQNVRGRHRGAVRIQGGL